MEITDGFVRGTPRIGTNRLRLPERKSSSNHPMAQPEDRPEVGSMMDISARQVRPTESTAPSEGTVAFEKLPFAYSEGLLVSDCSPIGYVPQEFLMSGMAGIRQPCSNTDSWPAFQSRFDDKAATPSANPGGCTPNPVLRVRGYKVRVLVYQPQDMRRFSGNVILEVIHPRNNGHLAVWSVINRFFSSRGDIVVGLMHPFSVDDLHAANPQRYRAVTVTDPTQLWDIIRQLGMAVKTGRLTAALSEGQDSSGTVSAGVHRLYHTGYSYTSTMVTLFAQYYHEASRLPNGAPLIDGYVPMTGWKHATPSDAPVIHLATQSDFFGYTDNTPFDPTERLNQDGDSRGKRSRYYEVPGAFHIPLPSREPGAARCPEETHSRLASCRAHFPSDMQYPDMPIRG
ncbi:MAG: alpha/beta hydrolase domain-containing protein, partial [Nitrososphaerales archaeon]